MEGPGLRIVELDEVPIQRPSRPLPPLRWGKSFLGDGPGAERLEPRLWFDVDMGPEAQNAADVWLGLLREHPLPVPPALSRADRARRYQERCERFAAVLHAHAFTLGMTRFSLRDQDAAGLARVSNVQSFQRWRTTMQRAGWLDVKLGRARRPGQAGRVTAYTLNVPAWAVPTEPPRSR
jgi:hypothetical protein